MNFNDYVDHWEECNISQKEYLLHDYLNIELSLGVFTHQIGDNKVLIQYDSSHEIVININNSLCSVSDQIEAFIDSLS